MTTSAHTLRLISQARGLAIAAVTACKQHHHHDDRMNVVSAQALQDHGTQPIINAFVAQKRPAS